jgi:peptidoglycan/LPS O-acetylase OafA/YrhL
MSAMSSATGEHAPPVAGGTPARALGLDVLRVAAALGVLVTHVAFATGVVSPERWSWSLRDVLPRLDVGVTVFFVLSGLLITRPFLRRVLDDAPPPALGTYAKRRLSRVYPLYWVVLGVVLLTSAAPRPPLGQLLADVTLLHVYRPSWAIGPITQAWSLSTELAFYAFVPVWFAACRAVLGRLGVTDRSARIRWLAAGLVGWAVVALAYRAGVVAATEPFRIGDPISTDRRGALLTWLPNHLDAFAVGTGLALWLESGRAHPLGVGARAVSYAVAAAALWVASTALGLPPLFTGFDGPQTLARHALFVVVAGAAVLPSVAALAGPRPERSASRRRPVAARVAGAAALGSYGVYLWHQWVTDEWMAARGLADFAAPFLPVLGVVVVASGALAAATYWFVERPASTLVLQDRPPPAVPARRLGRHPELDGLRGLSILAVLATHVVFLDSGSDRWALPGGFLGVDVFLVLSGFLVGAVLLREIDRTGSVDGTDFARRRVRRLYPPLVLFLVVQALVAVVILDAEVREQLLQAALALTFTANWQLSFGHQPPFDLVHLWSLSVEGQFYVLMAVGLWALRRRLRRPDLVVAGLVLASVGCALWRLYLYRSGVELTALYERTGARVDSMFLGVAAAVVWRSRLVGDRVLRRAGAVGLAVLGVASVVARPDAAWLFRGGFTLIAAAAAAAVAAAATGGGAVARLGAVRGLRWVGGISYSLYLWHLPIYLWVVTAAPDAPLAVKAAVAVIGSFAAAYLSYRLVEVRVLAPWRHVGAPGARATPAAPAAPLTPEEVPGGRPPTGGDAQPAGDGQTVADGPAQTR